MISAQAGRCFGNFDIGAKPACFMTCKDDSGTVMRDRGQSSMQDLHKSLMVAEGHSHRMGALVLCSSFRWYSALDTLKQQRSWDLLVDQ